MITRMGTVWKRVATLATLVLAVGMAGAQDYKTLQGSNQRQGRNEGVLASPGRGLLSWFAPFIVNNGDFNAVIRDNGSSAAIISAGWNSPAPADETGNGYRVARTGIVGEDLVRGYDPNDDPFVVAPPPPIPSYRYAFTIPAGQGTDPTVQNFGADPLRTFEWVLEPFNIAERVARNYALHVWLPTGPTGDGAGGLLFTQRYFVYEILYGNGKRWIDVVDTYVAGSGWVRLGNGGRPTNQLFDYDGTNPIRIRLYNTVPRLAGHENDVVNNPLVNWLSVYTDIPYTSVVYADAAMAVPTSGDVAATPIVTQIDPGNALLGTHAVYARNNYAVGVINGTTVTTISGSVTSVDHSTGVLRWNWVPLIDSQYAVTSENNAATTTAAPPFLASTTEPGFLGTNYHLAPIVNVLGTESLVTYSPTLADGTYEIYAWCAGTRGLENLGTQIEVRIREGAITTTLHTMNQDTGRGWVKIGTRRFTHDGTGGEPLRVDISNYSPLAADLGRNSYADAIKFVGAANLSIVSTPVHATANVIPTNGGVPTPTNVVVVATEDGKLHCLDAQGNGDGTTREYWSYPSTPDPNNPGWTDPNAVATEDGGVATMPIGFDLSSALIQNIGGADYLFIASRNGRVYCIEMAGRGDMNFATRVPGTTRRVWSFPDDFPATPQRSFLGAFTGSLTFATPPSGPTIYAPTTQGRLYALEALPAGANPNKVTTIRWAYPPVNQPTAGPMYMTPMSVGNTIFVGTGEKAGDDRGRFYALDWDTGAVQWEFNSAIQWDPLGVTAIGADDFIAGPAYATAAELGGGMPDTVFVANENRFITALDATTGALLWTSRELNSGVLSNLTFTTLDAFTGVGIGRANAPVVMVPTTDGRFSALFARAGAGFGATNVFGGKLAWQYNTPGAPLYSSLSVGRGHMLGGDSSGFVYAFNDIGDGFGNNIDGPGEEQIVPNDNTNADVINYRDAKILFVTKDTYQRLRLPQTDTNLLTYPQTTADPLRVVTRTQFDWGEYLYILVYDLPYDTTTPAPPSVTVPPPTVNYAFSVDGTAFRNLSMETRQFKTPATAPLAPDGVSRLDGYAILAFPIQGGGSNAMPPGSASVSISISTSAAANPPRQVNIGLNPVTSRRDFGISNPISLAIVQGDPLRSIGVFVDPSEEGRTKNGSPNLTTTPLNREDRLTATTTVTAHGKAGTTQIGVVDASLMTLLRGPGRGLDNVRFDRQDLNWRGGRLAVVKRIIDIPFYASFYAGGKGLEDYPDLAPNVSLDYPDIERERIRVVKDLNGNAENPVFGPVSINPPTNVDENAVPFPTRIFTFTPFDISVDIPQFQPANLSLVPDSANVNVDAGYMGRMGIFVDTDGSGTITRGGGRREAFRVFWLGSSVAIDNSFQVETPTIDFGAVGSGTGYNPSAPGAANSNYTPFPTPIVPGGFDYDRNAFPYTDLWRPIVVRNTGNTNLINLRLAKAYDQGAGLNPWEIFSANDHELLWLDSTFDLHASFDARYALVPVPVLQKARVGDASGTTLSDISIVRDNPNLNAIPGFLFQPGTGSFPDVAREVLEKGPRIGISVPLGFPATRLSQLLRVFEDGNGDESLSMDGNFNFLENAGEPTVRLLGTVRESRITNSYTPKTAPMIENLVSSIVGNESFTHSNSQPAVMRSVGGHLFSLFVSDRFSVAGGAGFDKPQPASAQTNPEPRLYLAGVQGVNPNTLAGASPLRDLNAFVPNNTAVWPNGRWWRRDVAEYPNTPLATLFPGDPVVAGTARFGNPAFPASGDVNPFTGAVEPFVYVTFGGNTQKQGIADRYTDNRIFIARMTIAGNGTGALAAPVGLPNDPQMNKGRPSVVQSGQNATVFYSAAGTGQSAIHYATFDGTNWSPTSVFNTGTGFEATGGPSVVARSYQGVGSQGTANNGQNILEISFVGKLRGRPWNEIYWGRMTCGGNAAPIGQVFFPLIQNERLVADRETGIYRASGVTWNRRNTIQVFQSLNGAAPVDIEVANTRTTDESTGTISFDTILGGKAYLDPNLGTVRLANTLPARGSQLYLTYQPRFLRLSAGGAAYSGPNTMFDNRLIGELSYWATPGNTAVTMADAVRPSRFVFTYNKAAAANQVARPHMQTVRAGIQLPASVATRQDGTIVSLTVTGASSYYQVDPANARLYFTDADENRTVTVAFTGLDDAGNAVVYAARQYTIGLLTERSEGPIPIDQAANETQLSTYMDPFEGTLANRRPSLFWLFWTSSRVGSPDIYFETLAPRFTPQPRGN